MTDNEQGANFTNIKVDDETVDLNKSKQDIKIFPLRSRLSLTDAELKKLDNLTRWQPYENAAYEQPCCFSFCCAFYFQLRWFLLSICRISIPLTVFTFGKVLFFCIFILIAAGLGYLVWDSLSSSGLLACLFLALSYAFPTRNSVWLFLTGIPFERVLFWHKFVAVISVGMGIYHGVIAGFDLSGVILVALMFLLNIFAFYMIRRKYFECFYRFHWILFLIAVPVAAIHGAGLALIGAGFWLVDVVIRYMLVRKNKKRVEIAEITQIQPSLVKICFPNNNFHYKAGQYVFLCVPELTMWEWHPFSLSSSPNEKNVSLHVRVLGDWTKRLYELSGNREACTKLWIDGPYGNCTLNIDSEQYKLFILISGGIGITPLQSVCNQLIYEHIRGRILKKILFIWSVKDKFLYDSVSENPDAFYVKKLPRNLPYAFQPDVLIKHEHENVLDSFFHLTNVRNEKDFNKANIDPMHQKLLKFGRPNLPSYFDKIKKLAKDQNESKVAILTCGPEPMMIEARKLCREYSGDGIQFDFHEETFNF